MKHVCTKEGCNAGQFAAAAAAALSITLFCITDTLHRHSIILSEVVVSVEDVSQTNQSSWLQLLQGAVPTDRGGHLGLNLEMQKAF